MVNFGPQLRELRQSKGLTLRELAAQLGVSYSALAQYETETRIPRDDVKIAIADFFGVSVQDIFFN